MFKISRRGLPATIAGGIVAAKQAQLSRIMPSPQVPPSAGLYQGSQEVAKDTIASDPFWKQNRIAQLKQRLLAGPPNYVRNRKIGRSSTWITTLRSVSDCAKEQIFNRVAHEAAIEEWRNEIVSELYQMGGLPTLQSLGIPNNVDLQLLLSRLDLGIGPQAMSDTAQG